LTSAPRATELDGFWPLTASPIRRREHPRQLVAIDDQIVWPRAVVKPTTAIGAPPGGMTTPTRPLTRAGRGELGERPAAREHLARDRLGARDGLACARTATAGVDPEHDIRI
jgi:hypothetical protein